MLQFWYAILKMFFLISYKEFLKGYDQIFENLYLNYFKDTNYAYFLTLW